MSADVLGFFNNVIYGAMALSALFGVFVTILLIRRIAQKRFSSAGQSQEFMDEIHEHLDRRDFDAVKAKCDTPPFWSKATPQLMQLAMEQRTQTPGRLRQLLAERFERSVLADLEYRTSWVATVVKTAPMLGLLGTVMGMIAAFGKIAGMASQGGAKPELLAEDISFALLTTAIGLSIAIPLVVAGNMLQIRIGKLQDSVQEQIGEFLNHLTAVQQESR